MAKYKTRGGPGDLIFNIIKIAKNYEPIRELDVYTYAAELFGYPEGATAKALKILQDHGIIKNCWACGHLMVDDQPDEMTICRACLKYMYTSPVELLLERMGYTDNGKVIV